MNGPTEREQRWQQILRDHFPRPANLMTMHKPALALMAEADRESAALWARVAVLEQQIAAIEALCYRDGYTTWDVDKHLPGNGWKPDDPKVLAWEAAHGHDPRLKCYPEFGCQLLIDPEDILAILAAGVVDNPTEDDANADPFTLDDLGHPTEGSPS